MNGDGVAEPVARLAVAGGELLTGLPNTVHVLPDPDGTRSVAEIIGVDHADHDGVTVDIDRPAEVIRLGRIRCYKLLLECPCLAVEPEYVRRAVAVVVEWRRVPMIVGTYDGDTAGDCG